MIDFHTHLLPGIDDGSQSVEETKAILQAMYAQGVTAVVATPHFDMRRESVESFLKRRERALEQVSGLGITTPVVIPGAEVLYCGVPLYQCEQLEKLCIGSSRYLLIETLYNDWTEEFQNDLHRLMLEKNITPVLAHIERYYFLGKNRKKIRSLNQNGVLLQMNAEAFLYKKMQRSAYKILKKEAVSVLGSDCHNMTRRPPNLGEAVEVIKNRFGEEVLERFSVCESKILNAINKERE